jgi:hypothetical protein
MINTSTLRPGLLVSLKTSVRGNVQYSRKDIEREKTTKDGQAHAKWETEKTVTDKKEYDAAYALRVQCRQAIAKPCANSAFGLLCPEDNLDELEAAIKEARKLTNEFNATATLTRVEVHVLTGRVAQDDVEAVRAINSEIADLLATMEKGLKNLDAKAVREAANKAKQIGPMLSADAEAKVQIAIEAARQSAKQIVKAGEQASMEIDTLTIKKIAKQRTAFLDLDDAREVVTPKAKARKVDFAPAEK